jgi:hypothetical protein
MEMLERQKNEVIAYHFEETAFARLILITCSIKTEHTSAMGTVLVN